MILIARLYVLQELVELSSGHFARKGLMQIEEGEGGYFLVLFCLNSEFLQSVFPTLLISWQGNFPKSMACRSRSRIHLLFSK